MQTDVGGEYPNWWELLEKICVSLGKDVSPKRVKQCGAPNQVHLICSHFQAFATVRADQFG